MNIKKVSVLGTGNMGQQISLLCAINGFETSCYDINDEVISKMQTFVESYLAGRVTKGRLTQEQADSAKEKLSFYTDLECAVKNADIVIEAVPENLELKRKIFSDLDKFTKKTCILATNSSMIASSNIADVVSDSSRVCNMHFFNPALVMKTVEVVQGEHTAQETAEIAFDFCKAIGKTPVMLYKEVEGFCVNTILTSIFRSAFWLLDHGVVSPEGLDTAVKGALGHPMGPCELVDMTGIDLEYFVWKNRYDRTGLDADKIPNIIVEKYEKGEYGRKTGKGFYEYK